MSKDTTPVYHFVESLRSLEDYGWTWYEQFIDLLLNVENSKLDKKELREALSMALFEIFSVDLNLLLEKYTNMQNNDILDAKEHTRIKNAVSVLNDINKIVLDNKLL